MSIAVSARIKPSRTLRLLLCACGLAQLAAALAVGLAGPGRYAWAPLQALALAAAGATLLGSAMALPKTRQIDISGTGDLRVTVQQGVGAEAMRDQASVLLPGSLLWPVLMALRHGAPGTPARTLLIARDSVDAATWRALAVALAALGRARASATDVTTR